MSIIDVRLPNGRFEETRPPLWAWAVRVTAVPLVTAGVALLASGIYVPFLTPVAGLAAVLGVPVYMVLTTTEWRDIPWRERVVLSVSAAIVMVLVVGLITNFALPLFGVNRPLDRVPLVCSTGVAWTLVWWRRRRHWQPLLAGLPVSAINGGDAALVALAAATIVMSVVGADRLNNDAGSGAAVLTQMLVVLLLVSTLVYRRRLAAGTAAVALYAAALALLFQTSLRGWFISGHDSQGEYYVFTQTLKAGHWSFANVPNPYNACLSITVLPTMILHFTGLDAPYVYKVCFQLLFAFSAVTVYAISARLLSRGFALLATIVFISFPTFYTDMPFLNRQEIAFLFCGCCFLLFVMDEIPLHRRRAWTAAFLLATVVTHYSTGYLLLGALVIAKGFELGQRWRSEHKLRLPPRSPISIFSLALAAAVALAWGSGPAHTDTHLDQALHGVIDTFKGSISGSRASAVGQYSLFVFHTASPEQLLHKYVKSTLPRIPVAKAAAQSVLSTYPPKLAPTINLPSTALGRALDRAGISVGALNSLVRSWSARILEILVLVGLIGAIRLRHYRAKVGSDFYFVALGSVVMVGLVLALPQVSVDYGLLRAFQQALFVLAPFVIIGATWAISWAGQRLAATAASALTFVLLISLTGLMPQELGGYPAQLTLNNSGQYYNLYYVSTQELAAAKWLGANAPARSGFSSDTNTANTLFNYVDLFYEGNIFPTLLSHRGTFIFLGYQEVRAARAPLEITGTGVTYDYPIRYLDTTRNLIYASPDDRVYY